jgi:hypothetical protein
MEAWMEAAYIMISTFQGSQVSLPATAPVALHVFVTPVVREIPTGSREPASLASVW